MMQKDFPPDRLRYMLAKMQRKETPQYSFKLWRQSQERQSWWFAVISGMVLVLIVFIVAGGCR